VGNPGETPPSHNIPVSGTSRYKSFASDSGPYLDSGTHVQHSTLSGLNLGWEIFSNSYSGDTTTWHHGDYIAMSTGYFTYVPGTVNTWRADVQQTFLCSWQGSVYRNTASPYWYSVADRAEGIVSEQVKIYEVNGQSVDTDYAP